MLDSGINTFVSARYSTGQLNWLHAFFGVGSFIGPSVVIFWVNTAELSWRYSYGLVAFLQLALLTLLLATRSRWTIPDDDDTSEKIPSPPSIPTAAPNTPMLETMMIPIVFLSVLFFFLYGGAEVGTPQLGTSLFVDSRNVKESTASLWITIYWVSFTLGRMFFGIIANRMKIVMMMRLTLIGATLGSLMLTANTSDTITVLGLIIMGVAFAPMFATVITVTTRQLNKRHAANAIGIQIGFAGLGIAFLPGLAGVLADSIDLEIIGPFITINIIIMFAVYELMLWRSQQVPQPIPIVVPTD
jgi:fucose permease